MTYFTVQYFKERYILWLFTGIFLLNSVLERLE